MANRPKFRSRSYGLWLGAGAALAIGVAGGCNDAGNGFFEWFILTYSRSCGQNTDGQLGDETNSDLNSFLQRRLGTQRLRGADGGAGHTVAIASNGTVIATGNNSYGQLGDGTTNSRNSPVEVPGISNAEKVEAGWFHSLILTRPPGGLRGRRFGSAQVYAMGDNFYGQLGDGGVLTHSTTPVVVPIVGEVRDIHVGQWDTSFAIMTDGSVQAWGVNANGEIGDGTDVNRLSPTTIPGLSDVKKVAGGGQHTLFLKQDGTVWATGMNTFGQLGLGIADPKVFVPTMIPGLMDIDDIAAGAEHSIAITRGGKVFTWGRNFEGQLGTGPTPSSRNTPAEVTGLICAARATAGMNFTVVVLWDGTVRTFGENTFGQLGDETSNNRSTPIVPSGDVRRAFHSAAGHNHLFLLGSDEPYSIWEVNRQGVAPQVGEVWRLPISVTESGSSTPFESTVVVCSRDGSPLEGLHAYPSHLAGPLSVRVLAHRGFLSKVVTVPAPVGGADVDLGIIELRNGDVNGDNSVGIPDFIQLRNAFGSTVGGPTWNPNADLNKDGSVSIADFVIFRASFGAAGE